MIHVVAAAVTDAVGRVLIAERPPGKQLAGHWEFPGGKLEPGETRRNALARELREELGITIRDPRPLMRLRHAYDFGDVLIDMWVVTRYHGEPRGLDGQRLRWCTLDELAEAGLLPADRPLLGALRLPERLECLSTSVYAIGHSADHRLAGRLCLTPDEARKAADENADFIVLGIPVQRLELAALAESLSIPLFAFGIELDEAWNLGCCGINGILTP